MSTAVYDVVASSGRTNHKLGRAWLTEKDGKSRMSIDLSSMPLPSQEVHLVDTDNPRAQGSVAAFSLKSPIEREGKKTYWHPVGQIERVAGANGQVYRVSFESMPLSGNLAAFEMEN